MVWSASFGATHQVYRFSVVQVLVDDAIFFCLRYFLTEIYFW